MDTLGPGCLGVGQLQPTRPSDRTHRARLEGLGPGPWEVGVTPGPKDHPAQPGDHPALLSQTPGWVSAQPLGSHTLLPSDQELLFISGLLFLHLDIRKTLGLGCPGLSWGYMRFSIK